MNLDYLDHHLPKRWNLLLHYWLPFLPTPSDFYFQSRSFIDQLIKHFLSVDFPLEKFPDLLIILVKYAHTPNEKEVAKKIIAEIFLHKTKKFRLSLLGAVLKNFSPEDENIAILEEVFRRIPNKLFIYYFNPILKDKNCSSLNLQWCAYFKDKFSLKDRLTLCLSLPDDKLVANQTTLSKLVIEECEKKFIRNFDLNPLNEDTTHRLLSMNFTHLPTHLFSKPLLRSFVNQLLKKTRESKKGQKTTIDSYLKSLDIDSRDSFFKNFLAELENQQNIEYFLGCCPKEQRSTLVDRSIVSAFNANNIEKNNDLTTERLGAINPNLLLLTVLQKQTIPFSVNQFQFLAIAYLTKQTFDLDVLKDTFKKALLKPQGWFNDHHSFPPAVPLVIAESYISTIKKFIKDQFMIHVPKENTRQDIHYIFNKFYNDENYYKLPNVAALILEKLPDDLRSRFEADLHFLQQLLSQLYLIIADSSVTQYKNERLMKQMKSQRDYEEKIQASQELRLRLYQGEQSMVSYQYMGELFGEKAPALQKKLSNKLGVNFFNAEDPKELAIANKEAEAMKAMRRKCKNFYSISTITCELSTSPCIASYLTF